MAFTIKRNDRRPYLKFQFFEPNGSTPLNVSAATAVNIAVRKVGTGPDEPPKFKRPVVMLDSSIGLGEYRWAATDTDEVGSFEYEFEITWTGGELQTIPADSYFSLTVFDDIG